MVTGNACGFVNVIVCALPFRHTLFVPDIVAVGTGLTVTVAVDEFIQLFASVPEIVYTVVLVGLAFTLLPVVADKPVDGDQSYVDPPDAVRAIELPLQIAGEEGVTVIVGFGLTVTVTVVGILGHPFEVAVTV